MSTDRWAAIERIFHEALEQAPEARAAFLDDSCGGDDELRREVEALLKETTNTGFLEQPAIRIAADLAKESGSTNLTGQRIGVYQFQGLLGRGGMGEVYRARDTRLDRDVAVKVLPRAVTADADRLARFEREARVLASLNHPHIGMIHGLEESSGVRALVLELIEGDTLADRIARGPIPVKQALAWARQIADALDAAHEKGIVHRDLKPANVKITPNDVVKVLDFGLARTYTDQSDQTRSPTITSDGGVILGTAAYMSPEQARGQAVGKRADIWAFGCVLYEMLTGRLAFDAASVSETLAAVLNNEPDWSAIPPRVPSSVTTLLQRCLEKDVKQRRRDIGDVRAEIDDILAQPISGSGRISTVRPAARRPPMTWWLLAAGAVALAALAGGLAGRRWTAVPPEAAPVAFSPFKQLTDFVGMEEMPAVSPNGNEVAFVFPENRRRQIWRRVLAEGAPLQITTDDIDHEHPRWDPESTKIVYYTSPAKEGESGYLWEISALGGTRPHRIAMAITGADISRDGKQLATFQRTGERNVVLAILNRQGETIRTHKVPSAIEFGPPRWAPDDQHIAFVANEGNINTALYTIPAAGGEPREVVRVPVMLGMAWLPDGSGLVYASSLGSTLLYPPVTNLFRISLDGRGNQEITRGDVSYAHPDVGRTGQIFASRVRRQSDIWGFPVAGSPADNVRRAVRVTQQTAHVQTPTVSPDGKELAYLSDVGGHANIWVKNADGTGTPRQITTEADPTIVIGIPLWSPAEKGHLVYITLQEKARSHLLIDPAVAGGSRKLTDGGTAAAWSADGRSLYYQKYSPGSGSCVYKTAVNGTAGEEKVRCGAALPMPSKDEKTLFFSPGGPEHANEIHRASPPAGESTRLIRYLPEQMPFYPTGSVLSPDNRWIATPIKDGHTTNIWIASTADGAKRQITDFGRRATLIARQVAWAPDGKFIYAAVAENDADIVLVPSPILPATDRPVR
jgi:eukaryotic-like serine/threonine-protein kinase